LYARPRMVISKSSRGFEFGPGRNSEWWIRRTFTSSLWSYRNATSIYQQNLHTKGALKKCAINSIKMKITILIISFCFFLFSCTKQEQDCTQLTRCTRTFATYSDCTPEDGKWDQVYWTTTVSKEMSVCDTLEWRAEIGRAELENYKAGDSEWRRFLDAYPTKCDCHEE